MILKDLKCFHCKVKIIFKIYKLTCSANLWSTTIEPVGKAFETFLRVINGNQNLIHSPTSEQEPADDEEDAEEAKKYAAHKKATSLDALIGTADYYELLGLGETRWTSTPEDIKKACKSKITSFFHIF